MLVMPLSGLRQAHPANLPQQVLRRLPAKRHGKLVVVLFMFFVVCFQRDAESICDSFSKATFLLPQNVLTHHPRTIFLQPSFFPINVLTHYIYIQESFFFAFRECPLTIPILIFSNLIFFIISRPHSPFLY